MRGRAGRTIGRGGREGDVFGGRLAAQGHPGSRQVNFGAPAGVGTDLRVLVEIQLSRVHDLPARQGASVGTRQDADPGAPELLRVLNENQSQVSVGNSPNFP